jgi:hypothetical protein
MKSNLLDEERGTKQKYPGDEPCQLKDMLASKTVMVVVFVDWGMYPKKYCNNLLSSLLGLEVVVGSRRIGRLSSSLLLICDRRSFVVSGYFVFELGLAKTLFCYPVIMEPGSV